MKLILTQKVIHSSLDFLTTKSHHPSTPRSDLPSAVILMSEISAGVPMKLPTPPAAMPMAAFMKKLGDLLSLEISFADEIFPSQTIK